MACRHFGIPLYQTYYGTYVSSQALSTANTWAAFEFVAETGQSSPALDSVYVRVSAVTGTLQSGDLQCDVYSMNTPMKPGSQIASTTTVDALPTGARWVRFDFSPSVSLTRGYAYFVVIKCPNAGSGRYVTIIFTPNAYYGVPVGIMDLRQRSGALTTDGGTTWSDKWAAGIMIGLKFAGSVYMGPAIETVGGGTNLVAGYRHGTKFTTYAHAEPVVHGAAIGATVAGSGCSIKLKVSRDTTEVYSTIEYPLSQWSSSGGPILFTFDSPVVLRRNSTYRMVVESVDGTSTNCIRFYRAVLKNDTNFLALKPMNGTLQSTLWNGSGWSDTANEIPVLIPFLSASSGPNMIFSNRLPANAREIGAIEL